MNINIKIQLFGIFRDYFNIKDNNCISLTLIKNSTILDLRKKIKEHITQINITEIHDGDNITILFFSNLALL